MSLIRIYAYQDKILVPTVAQAEEGFYMDVEPVAICHVSDATALRQLIRDCLAAENRVVPTPQRNSEYQPGSPVLDKLGLKKWFKFEADATMYNVHVNEQTIEYFSTGKPVNGSWRSERATHRQFDRNGGTEEFLDTILGDINSDYAAREEAKKPKPMALLPKPLDQ